MLINRILRIILAVLVVLIVGEIVIMLGLEILVPEWSVGPLVAVLTFAALYGMYKWIGWI